jgi:hypothetical protein
MTFEAAARFPRQEAFLRQSRTALTGVTSCHYSLAQDPEERKCPYDAEGVTPRA